MRPQETFFLHTLARLMFASFKQASRAIACRNIFREELVLFFVKGVSPGWWDKEVLKITYKIVSGFIEFSFEVKDTQENCVNRALFALNDRILLKKPQKFYSILAKR